MTKWAVKGITYWKQRHSGYTGLSTLMALAILREIDNRTDNRIDKQAGPAQISEAGRCRVLPISLLLTR